MPASPPAADRRHVPIEDVLVVRDLVDQTGLLRGLDLTLAPGDSLALVGDAASSRAVLEVLAGLRPARGSVHWRGQDLLRISERRMAHLRRTRIGVVVGVEAIDLPVLHSVAIPLLLHGIPHRRAVSRAADLLDPLGLSGVGAWNLERLSPRQRVAVALARALVIDPAIVLAEDPARLDPALSRADRRDLLIRFVGVCRARGIGLVLTTSRDDADLADSPAGLCSQRLLIRDGRACRPESEPGTRDSEIVYAEGALR